jgi:hypothetical protein
MLYALFGPNHRWLLVIFFALLLCPLAPTVLQAQSDDSGTTVPGGTIPTENQLFLPLIASRQQPTRIFDRIPIAGAPLDRPAALHPDVNLSIRSYISTTGELGLININGDTDSAAPQLIGIFDPPRLPSFTALYQVYDWNWACGGDGCRGAAITWPEVSLLAVATTPGEMLHIPTRGPEIHGGGYIAMVLYAEATRITLAYTRDDTAALGYVVHLEDIAVDPALLALYNETNTAGRRELPALHNSEPFATAPGTSIKLAIRDTGSFMDPRSRKDWWMGFVRQ